MVGMRLVLCVSVSVGERESGSVSVPAWILGVKLKDKQQPISWFGVPIISDPPHLPWLNDEQAPLVGNLGGVKHVISEQTTPNI